MLVVVVSMMHRVRASNETHATNGAYDNHGTGYTNNANDINDTRAARVLRTIRRTDCYEWHCGINDRQKNHANRDAHDDRDSHGNHDSHENHGKHARTGNHLS